MSFIGPTGSIEARVIGLKSMENLATDLSGPALAWAMKKRQKKAGKGSNDQPVSDTVGSDQGKPVRDASWMPEY